MKSHKRMAMISVVILFLLGCLSVGAWLAFERPAANQLLSTTLHGAVGSAWARVVAAAPVRHHFHPSAANRPRIVENYGRIPLSFEANGGQSDSRVKFVSRGSG